MVLSVLRRVGRGHSTPETIARRATNDDMFGPSTEDLQQLTTLSFKPKSRIKILDVMEYRFNQSDRHWRQKSKTLTVLQYFLIHGPPECFQWMQQRREMFKKLLGFRYLDSRNNDQGLSVREKAESLLQVIRNPERLKEAKLAYKRQREGLRKSIGAGRPSTQSRNTLEALRDNILSDPDTTGINGAFQSALESSRPPLSAISSPSEVDVSAGGLCAIEEES